MRPFCIFRIFEYGFSGNELPPPCMKSTRYAVSIEPNEDLDTFIKRMTNIGVDLRHKLRSIPAKPYSMSPDCDWEIVDAGSLADMAIFIERLKNES